VNLNDPLEDELVLELVRRQRPDLAGLELRYVGRGWANEMWRLGDALAVRMPRTEHAPEDLRREYRWLRPLASRLPLPVPTPVFLGEPSDLFPEPWAIVEWVSGAPADREEVTKESSAEILASFLRALHDAPVPDLPGERNACRLPMNAGADFGDDMIENIGKDRVRRLEEIWEDARQAPEWDRPLVCTHNDLHPANAVVKDGDLSGVIDFGEFGPGDPAVDLSAAWTLLPSGSAERFLQLYGKVDAATVRRAQGCAIRTGSFVLSMAMNGLRGLPGGKPGWLPAARKVLERIAETC
jgi:aminoglycoside phosphotransferase (APT) family kinase protein